MWARCHHYKTESTVRNNQVHLSDHDVVLLPGLLLIFLHGCEIKSGWDLGRGYIENIGRSRTACLYIENMGGRELPVCGMRGYEVGNCLIVHESMEVGNCLIVHESMEVGNCLIAY